MQMALSFTLRQPLTPAPGNGPRRKVLVTGASGNIGSYFAEHCAEEYDLRLMAREAKKGAEIQKFGKWSRVILATSMG